MLRENHINREIKSSSSKFSYTDVISDMKILSVVISLYIYHMPSQGEQYSEFFRLFWGLHTRWGTAYFQAINIPCVVSCWVPQHHTHTRDKECFKVSLRTWQVHDVGWLLVLHGCLGWDNWQEWLVVRYIASDAYMIPFYFERINVSPSLWWNPCLP